MIKLAELDDSTPFLSQLQETTGPVTLVNVLVAPEGELDAVIAVWEADAKLMKANRASSPCSCIGAREAAASW